MKWINWIKEKPKLIIGLGISLFLIISLALILVYNNNIYKQETAKLTTILSAQKNGKEDYNTEYKNLISFKETCKSKKVSDKITTRITELDALADDEYSKICDILKTDNVNISELQQHVTNYKNNLSYNNKITNIDDFKDLIKQYQTKLDEVDKIQKFSNNKNSNLEFLQELQTTESQLEQIYGHIKDMLNTHSVEDVNYPRILWNSNKQSIQNSIDKLRKYSDEDNHLFTTSEYDKIGETLTAGWNIGFLWNKGSLSAISDSDSEKLAKEFNKFKSNKDEVISLISNKINYINTCDSNLSKLNNEKNDLAKNIMVLIK